MRSYTEIERNVSRIKGLETYKEALSDKDILILEIDRYDNDKEEYIIKGHLDEYTVVMKYEESKGSKKNKFNRVVACMIYEIDEENKSILVSRKKANEWYAENVISNFKEGDTVKGKIVNFSENKVYVEIGCGYVVKIGMKELSYTKIMNMHDYFRGISEIIMVVTKNENGELRLSLKDMLESSKESVNRFEVGEEIFVVVDAVYDDGVRVRIRPNLISKCYKTDGLEVGDVIKVKVTGKRTSEEENSRNYLDIEFIEKTNKVFRNQFYYRK